MLAWSASSAAAGRLRRTGTGGVSHPREPAALSRDRRSRQVLGRLENDPERFTPLLRAFEQMVEQQLHFKTARPNPYFHAPRVRLSDRVRLRLALAKERDRLVAVHVEANAHACEARVVGAPELLQLVAERVAHGERFEALLAARRPLAPSVPVHLEVPAERFANGEPVESALARFAAFLRPEDRLACWGRYPLDLLAAEGVVVPEPLNVRDAAGRALGRSPGGPEDAARALGKMTSVAGYGPQDAPAGGSPLSARSSPRS
jgi:hypothetical protein